MRIGVNLLYLIPSIVGGTETHAIELLRAIAKFHPNISLVLFSNTENDELLRGLFKDVHQVEVCSLDFKAVSRMNRMFQELFVLPKRMKEFDLDLLFSMGYTGPFISEIPHVLFIHDMQYKTFSNSFGLVARIGMHLLVTQGAKRARVVMTPSEFSKTEVLKYTSVSEDKVHFVHHGIHESFAEEYSEENLKKVILEQEGLHPPYILCVGYSTPQKNITALIHVFRELMDKIPHQLVLVGGVGRDEERVIEGIRKIPFERVLRLSNISRKKLISLYKAADLFVFPSIYEGFGFPVLEAMKSGVPVVATEKASLKEVMGGHAIPFDGTEANLKRKIEYALERPYAERQTMIQKARDWSLNFTWEKAANETIACLRQVIEESKKKSR